MSVPFSFAGIALVIYGVGCWFLGFRSGVAQVGRLQREARIRGFHSGLLDSAREAEATAVERIASGDNSAAIVARTIRVAIEQNAQLVRRNITNKTVDFAGPAEGT